MISDSIKKRVIELKQLLSKHNQAYLSGRPVISDSEYDNLYNELVNLETEFPELITLDSPTQKVDTEYEVVKGLETVIHKKPVLSLEKANSKEDLEKFINRLLSSFKEYYLVVEDKFDGLTLILDYDNGNLVDAVTRGNGGIKGERVLHVAKQIKSIPNKINFKGHLKVRGEAYMLKSVFELINKNGEAATARNLASGTIRTLDSKVVLERPLEYVAYEIIECDDHFESDLSSLMFLEKLGFKVPTTQVFHIYDQRPIDDICDYIEKYGSEIRKTLDYDIDGLVIKLDDITKREELGETSHHPKYAIAYKFKSENATTVLRKIEIATNRTGQISYTGIFDPVVITGSKISRATLNNEDFIKALDLKIGDRILVAKANDVIPKVIKSFPELRDGTQKDIDFPKNCPVCGGPLEKDGAHKFCINTLCTAKKEENLIHFASTGVMEIDGLGEKSIRQLVSLGMLDSITDIYSLKDKKDELSKIDGFGEKSVNKLLRGIEESKNRPLLNILYALSIKYVGQGTCKRLCKVYKSMNEILKDADLIDENDRLTEKDAFLAKLLSIEDIGVETANSIAKFFYSQSGRKLVDDLLNIGLKMEGENQSSSDKLAGLTIVVTGTLPTLSRKEAESLIESNGGKASGSVSKKTSFVLYGDDAGSKLTKAKELGIQCIEEVEFLKKIS